VSPSRLSTASIALVFALIAVVVAWQLSGGISATRLLICVVLTCPLWAPLRGLMRRPERRLWSGLSLALALLLFATLILYLRVTNPARSEVK
jgi:hypothetical protein